MASSVCNAMLRMLWKAVTIKLTTKSKRLPTPTFGFIKGVASTIDMQGRTVLKQPASIKIHVGSISDDWLAVGGYVRKALANVEAANRTTNTKRQQSEPIGTKRPADKTSVVSDSNKSAT